MILAHHTDAALIAKRDAANASPGDKVDALYLLPIPAEHRGLVASAARAITNRTPGYRYSDGLYLAGRIFAASGPEGVQRRLDADR